MNYLRLALAFFFAFGATTVTAQQVKDPVVGVVASGFATVGGSNEVSASFSTSVPSGSVFVLLRACFTG